MRSASKWPFVLTMKDTNVTTIRRNVSSSIVLIGQSVEFEREQNSAHWIIFRRPRPIFARQANPFVVRERMCANKLLFACSRVCVRLPLSCLFLSGVICRQLAYRMDIVCAQATSRTRRIIAVDASRSSLSCSRHVIGTSCASCRGDMCTPFARRCRCRARGRCHRRVIKTARS
jgi:hypothetical protein